MVTVRADSIVAGARVQCAARWRKTELDLEVGPAELRRELEWSGQCFAVGPGGFLSRPQKDRLHDNCCAGGRAREACRQHI